MRLARLVVSLLAAPPAMRFAPAADCVPTDSFRADTCHADSCLDDTCLDQLSLADDEAPCIPS